MPLESHSLVQEFPHLRERIHSLKQNSTHFAKLFHDYDKIEHEVHRIESGATSVSDAYLEDLKKKRLNLKDQLYVLLNKAA